MSAPVRRGVDAKTQDAEAGSPVSSYGVYYAVVLAKTFVVNAICRIWKLIKSSLTDSVNRWILIWHRSAARALREDHDRRHPSPEEDVQSMRRIRAFLFVALVSIVAFSVSAEQALAQDDDANVYITLTDHWVMGVTPDAAAAVLAGPVAFVAPPPSAGPPPSWPCITPKAPCTSDPVGGILIGLPLQQWPISSTTNCTTVVCGQIMAMFETTTGTGAVTANITIKQGTTTIYSKAAKGKAATANQVGVISVTGIKFATTAVAGAATVTVTTTVGTTKVAGKTTIYLM